MSFGTQTESQVLEKAIEDANRAGILIVSSAGNGGRSGVEYPAAYEEVIAVGAVFPDKYYPVNGEKGNKKNVCFHGGYKVNYIANYRYVTKVAKSAGEKYYDEKVRGQNSERRAFLYGIASHIITDCYAHSAFIKSGNVYKKIVHEKNNKNNDNNSILGADNTGKYQGRFEDAKIAMKRVLVHYKNKTIGSELDFATEENRKYYLGNVLDYAQKAKVSSTEKKVNEVYKK